MITLQLNENEIAAFTHEIDLKIQGLTALQNQQVLAEIGSAIFTISTKRLIKDLNMAAKIYPKKFHHIYEWGKVGDNASRLFYLKRNSVSQSNIRIEAGFLNSRTPVPIPPELLTPGAKGKSVTRRSIFSKKAEVMEAGQSVSFQAQRTLAFLGNSGIAFIPKDKFVNILNPGGNQVKGAFEKFVRDWYATKTISVIESSGIFKRLQDAITEALAPRYAGELQSTQAVMNTAKIYSEDRVVL